MVSRSIGDIENSRFQRGVNKGLPRFGGGDVPTVGACKSAPRHSAKRPFPRRPSIAPQVIQSFLGAENLAVAAFEIDAHRPIENMQGHDAEAFVVDGLKPNCKAVRRRDGLAHDRRQTGPSADCSRRRWSMLRIARVMEAAE